MPKKSKKQEVKEAGLTSSLLAVAIMLFSAGFEAFTAHYTTLAGVLAAAGFTAIVFQQVFQRKQFAFEDELAQALPSAQAIATTVEKASPSISQRIQSATTPDGVKHKANEASVTAEEAKAEAQTARKAAEDAKVMTEGDEFECAVCGDTFETENARNGHKAAHSK